LREISTGAPLPLRSLEGQVVLLDVWASWCAPCREELPMLDDLARRLDAKGIRVVAVSIDEDRTAALEFLRIREGWQLRVAHDPNQDVPRALRPPKMPTSYVIDRGGRLRHVHAGFERADAATIEGELLALAAQQPR
jgi:thiol-disulfide isomerase/thioredoxin